MVRRSHKNSHIWEACNCCLPQVFTRSTIDSGLPTTGTDSCARVGGDIHVLWLYTLSKCRAV